MLVLVIESLLTTVTWSFGAERACLTSRDSAHDRYSRWFTALRDNIMYCYINVAFWDVIH